MTEEYTGGSVSYYAVDINRPLDEEADPYKAECQDIIDALGMDFNEGCAFKAIWRRASARNLGLRKKGYDEGLYDAQKVEFYGARMVAKSTATGGPIAGAATYRVGEGANDLAEVLPCLPEGWIDIRQVRPTPVVGKILDLLMVNNTVRTVSYEPDMLFPDVAAWRFSHDGWIEHDGRSCPVAARVIVELRHRDGSTSGPEECTPNGKYWRWVDVQGGCCLSDIVAYRLA
jgi:hypothetical protein